MHVHIYVQMSIQNSRMYSVLQEIGIGIYSRTWIVSTLKGRKNKYSLSEVLTIQGAFNGIA